ncbi:MAG: FAD:protein FMN transferase [Clostridiales bacterium]|uniref:FAD:protein FMN transferase n=1 Tax=Flavonifractor porci TaxID=3133422 RepID=UPI00309EAF01|nr:FAD:protein FMN transferase [Clostridiales bacterium]
MKRFLPFLCCLLFLAGCTAPSATTDPAQVQFFSMDTVMSIRVYNDNGEDAIQAARQEIERLDKLLSRTDPNSQISLLNSHAGDGTLLPLDLEVADLLFFSKSVSHLLPGCFDITIAPVMDAWGFTKEEQHVPSADTLAAAMALVNSDGLIIENASSARLGQAGMEVDLGAVAKGFAAGQADAVLREHGVTSALLDLGGNVTAIGSKLDGSAWQVAVKDPKSTAEALCVLSLADQTASTSGGYERYFEENGQIYHHIIDPKNGYPADSGLLSVTVVSPDHMLADALSTTLFVAGPEQALDFWRSRDDFELVLCTQDNRVIVTEGLEEGYRPAGEDRGYTYEIARR